MAKINTTRDIVLFGSTGLIGSAIFRIGKSQGRHRIHVFKWSEIKKKTNRLPDFLNPRFLSNRGCDFVFANGLSDPKQPEETLRLSNYEFPKMVIEGTSQNKDHRYLTLGSILETVPLLCEENRYLQSKSKLGQMIKDLASTKEFSGRCLHLRLHTIYGDILKPYMFLGQMARALKKNQPFEMSSGEQLREYHHADEVALAIFKIVERQWDFGSMIDLTSGHAIRLKELATQIFRHFKKEDLLRIGACPRSKHEVLHQHVELAPPFLRLAEMNTTQRVIKVLTPLIQ